MGQLISDKYTAWKQECETRFQQLKSNDRRLTESLLIFTACNELHPYGLQ